MGIRIFRFDRNAFFSERDGGGRVILVSGAQTGDEVVTAGVHSLEDGQKVSLSKGLQS